MIYYSYRLIFLYCTKSVVIRQAIFDLFIRKDIALKTWNITCKVIYARYIKKIISIKQLLTPLQRDFLFDTSNSWAAELEDLFYSSS